MFKKNRCELDHKITELKTQISDMANQSKNGSIELQKVNLIKLLKNNLYFCKVIIYEGKNR